uniref:Uncharacterized protein n=1 Tax=Timema genevievae TaxID=629358 RepID=A0A7R9PLE6_TIMGE|nr:unnamed protein product [Timema genevievae]
MVNEFAIWKSRDVADLFVHSAFKMCDNLLQVVSLEDIQREDPHHSMEYSPNAPVPLPPPGENAYGCPWGEPIM